MPHYYHGFGTSAVGTDKTILTVFQSVAAPTTRLRIHEFNIGCGTAVADATTVWYLQRLTALGTEASGFTPVAIDPADPASVSDCGVGHTVEPTYTANQQVWADGVHQRASYRWIGSPGRDFITPATQNTGLGMKSLSSTGSATHTINIYWEE